MTIKQFMGITLLAVVGIGSSTYANPIQDVTPEQVLEAGLVLARNTNAVDSDIKMPEGILSSVIVEEAIVRNEPNPDAEIVSYLVKDIPVFVKERIDNWYHIEIEGIEGYIYKEQLNQETLNLVPYTKTVVEEPKVYLGDEIISYAKQFLGNPYVYGGNSLTKGVDCSGFVQQVLKKFDINVERSSRSQYASNGVKISKSDLLPGDLIFYGSNGHIDHVALYAGNGEIIHASTPKTGITMGDLYYGKSIIGIKRVIA